MRFGLGPHPVDVPLARLLALAGAAEEAGFDSVWVAEDRERPGGGGGLAAAAFLAQRTCLAIGVVVELGRHHPLRLAEEVAVADLCCGGRLELGVRPAAAAGTAEALGLVVAALSGRHLRWRGAEFRAPAGLPENGRVPAALALNPRPLQARVPVWLVGGDEALGATAAALGCGLARGWESRGRPAPAGTGLPPVLLCPGEADPESVAAAAELGAGYFLVEAGAEEALDVSRRLLPRLRMPELPDWVLA